MMATPTARCELEEEEEEEEEECREEGPILASAMMSGWVETKCPENLRFQHGALP